MIACRISFMFVLDRKVVKYIFFCWITCWKRVLKCWRICRFLHKFVKTCSTPLLACRKCVTQDILTRTSPSENSCALPVQCQERFLTMLILHGKTRDNRHIGALVRVSQIEVYTVKHGINAWRLFSSCAFYSGFLG